MNNLLIVFIVVTAVAVSIQAGILVGLFLTVRKSAEKMEALATDITSKTLPKMESVLAMMVELRPKIEVLTENVSESSTLVRNQLGRIDATLTDALDRTRLQVIRADELLNRTMDKVEETSDAVHRTVISPLRQVNGLMAAISTGVDVFLGQKRRHPKNGDGVPQDEMFI
jgi:hypothetical protein